MNYKIQFAMERSLTDEVTDEDLQNMILELNPPHGLDTPICNVKRKQKEIENYKKYTNPQSMEYEQGLRLLQKDLKSLRESQNKLMRKYDHVANLLVDREPISLQIPNQGNFTFRTYRENKLPSDRYIIYRRENTDSWYILLRYESQIGKILLVFPR